LRYLYEPHALSYALLLLICLSGPCAEPSLVGVEAVYLVVEAVLEIVEVDLEIAEVVPGIAVGEAVLEIAVGVDLGIVEADPETDQGEEVALGIAEVVLEIVPVEEADLGIVVADPGIVQGVEVVPGTAEADPETVQEEEAVLDLADTAEGLHQEELSAVPVHRKPRGR